MAGKTSRGRGAASDQTHRQAPVARYKTLSEHRTVHITPLFSLFLIRIFQLMSATPAGSNGQALSPLQDPAKGHLQPPGASPYSSDRPSHSGSDVSLHRVKNVPGYTTPVFKGKEEQRAKVQENVAAKVGVIMHDRVSMA